MLIRRAMLVLLIGALGVACATGPSVSDLPPAAGVAASPELDAAVVGTGPAAGSPQPGPDELPTSALDFFRSQETTCAQYATLLGRGDENYPPRVEEDRFRQALLVRELDRDTAVIEDGRGTRLVVDQWNTMGAVLPESGEPGDAMPAPYRLGCPPGVFIGATAG